MRGVDFAVRAGELVVVLGPNGAGKSTLVKAIAGLVPIHSGTAALGDVDITAVPAHEKVRHGLAFVPQTENIFATLSIHDNLLLAADILPKEQRGRRIAALYAMFPDLAARPSLRAGAAVGRPAADAGGGARADRRAVGADPRRAVGRPVAEDRRRGVRAG